MKPHANQRQTASYPLCWSTQHTPKRRHRFCIAGTIVNQAARRRYRGARQLQITVIQPVYPPCIGGQMAEDYNISSHHASAVL
jgi:hypothetical protein